MIKERYCSFEVAKLLKEKGFDVGISTYYYRTSEYTKSEMYRSWRHDVNWNSDEYYYSAPTHQMAIDWLREVHKIFIEISRSIDLNGNYHFSYTILDKECKYVRKGYTAFDWTYEDAVEEALKYCLTEMI